jgi:SAM-dependent methyltransferase
MQKLKLSLLLSLIVLALPGYAQLGHSNEGTNYSSVGAEDYAKSRHGKDGALFLDPYFLPFLTNIKNQTVLDAGCGAGPWSIFAAKNGAQVYGIDIQSRMIELANKNAADAGLTVDFRVGSVAQLPYEDNYFDRALSIMVGCNLPQEVFVANFTQLYRVLKAGGKLIITAPATFDAIFADNEQFDKQQVYQVLQNTQPVPEDIVSKLATLKDILRATFVIRGNNVVLVEDEKDLTEGEPIWRKIPGLVVPNFYHSENAYISQLLKAGFVIDRIDRPHFPSRQAWFESSCKLSQEYSYYHPFVIFHVSKP